MFADGRATSRRQQRVSKLKQVHRRSRFEKMSTHKNEIIDDMYTIYTYTYIYIYIYMNAIT
jgi:hypothetical protein